MTPIQDGKLQLTGVAPEQRVLFERVVEQHAEKYTQGAPAPSLPALYRHSGTIAAQDKPQPAAGRLGSAGMDRQGCTSPTCGRGQQVHCLNTAVTSTPPALGKEQQDGTGQCPWTCGWFQAFSKLFEWSNSVTF